MEFQLWHYWFIGAFIFLVIEIFVPGFIMGSMGLGCLLASLGAFLGLPLWFDIILAIIGFFLGLMLLKPLLRRLGHTTTVKTNAEGLIGRTGVISETIDPVSGTGRIRIDGDEWKAISQNGERIEKDMTAEILALESIVVTVRRLEPASGNNNKEELKPTPSVHENNAIIISVGNRKELIDRNEIFGFFSNQKITYLIHSSGKQMIVDESLERLEDLLDHHFFFRANRQFIITSKLVREYRSDSGGGLSVYLKAQSNLPEFISVSRLKAHAFRKWTEKHH